MKMKNLKRKKIIKTPVTVSIEGLDGVGKSTIARELQIALLANMEESSLIYNCLNVDSRTQMLRYSLFNQGLAYKDPDIADGLFKEAIVHTYDKHIKHEKSRSNIILDRWILSNYAYYRGYDRPNKDKYGYLELVPDVVFILCISPEDWKTLCFPNLSVADKREEHLLKYKFYELVANRFRYYDFHARYLTRHVHFINIVRDGKLKPIMEIVSRIFMEIISYKKEFNDE